MTKQLEQMTVEELVKGHTDFSDINILNELIRRAKLAEQQPTWKLTQILLELERAGVPEPDPDWTEMAGTQFIFHRSNFNHYLYFKIFLNYYKVDGEVIKTLPEAIAKLKELLGESCK